MNRIAAFVFLVNTFLPLIIAAAILLSCLSALSNLTAIATPFVASTKEWTARKEAEFTAVQTRLAANAQSLAQEAEAVGGRIGEVETSVASIRERLMRLSEERATVTERIGEARAAGTLNGGALTGEAARLAEAVDRQAMAAAVSGLADDLDRALAFSAPLGRLAEELRRFGPEIAAVTEIAEESRGKAAEAQGVVSRMLAAVAPIGATLGWIAVLLVPWLLISYAFWIRSRLRRAPAVRAGAI